MAGALSGVMSVAGETSDAGLNLAALRISERDAPSAISEPDVARPPEKADAPTCLRELPASFWGRPHYTDNIRRSHERFRGGLRYRFEGEDHEVVADEQHCGSGNIVGKEYDAYVPSVVSSGWCRIRSLKSALVDEDSQSLNATRDWTVDFTNESSLRTFRRFALLGYLPVSYETEITKPAGLFANAAKAYDAHVKALPFDRPPDSSSFVEGYTWASADHEVRTSYIKYLALKITEFEVTWPPEAAGQKILRAFPCAVKTDRHRNMALLADETGWDMEMVRAQHRIA
jgi:hypothetical protein